MTAIEIPAPARPRVRTGRVFLALLWRDVFVTGREFGVFLAQVAIQPLFMLFVFAKVLGDLNYVRSDFGELLLPGIVALTAFITALQSVSFPLVAEFGWTREIEDRLLAPIPIPLVAMEKIVISVLRGLVAGGLMFPVGVLVLGSVPWRPAGLPLLAVMLVLGTWAGAAIGMIIGTFMPPNRINIMFAVILTPLLFTGATQYPWPSLERLPWFQVVTALNPLTYVSEGVRAAVVPQVPHIAAWICLVVLVGCNTLATLIGMHGFRRRALD